MEILYFTKKPDCICADQNVRWLTCDDYDIFCDHLKLCGQRILEKAKWEQEREKAVAVTKAEQEKEVSRLAAEKAKYDKDRIVAEGQAEAIKSIQKANAEGITMLKEAGADESVLTLKSLEAFEKASNGQATKIIVPSNIQGIAGLAESIKEIVK